MRLLLLVPLLAVAFAACGRSGSPGTYRGTTLPAPFTSPAVTLTDTAGQPHDVAVHTKDAAALVFFGYTHCPDVCPTVLADAAAALRAVPDDVRRRTQLVFVTSDPARDTPPVLRDYLAGFDFGAGTTVTGLTGDYAEITRYASAFGVQLEPPVQTSGDYEVGHGARLTGVTTGGKGIVSWSPGEGDQLMNELRNDIPLLVGT